VATNLLGVPREIEFRLGVTFSGPWTLIDSNGETRVLLGVLRQIENALSSGKPDREIWVCYSCYFFWALSMSIGETGGHC
jgi:hypothetical protein